MRPLVSILVPAYNAAPWLSETLASAISQTWSRKEVIVVDDGSTDATLAIARTFESETVRVIGADHAGKAYAINRALDHAQGDYIQYLDADDLLTPDKIAKQVARLSHSTESSIATCRWARFYGSDPTMTPPVDQADFRDYPNPVDWLVQAWGGYGTMPPVAWLLPRGVVERTGRWHLGLSLNDDTEYFARICTKAAALVFCSDSIAYYRSGHTSLSGRRSRAALDSFFLACTLSAEHLLAVENSPRTREACANLWQHFAYWTFPDAPDLVEAAEQAAESLGGGSVDLKGSRTFTLAKRAVGWKLARRFQLVAARWRYLPVSSHDSGGAAFSR